VRRAIITLGASALWLTGCPSPPTDPPPPPRKPEIPVAPPRALGALAAGTDAAPRPEVTLPGVEAEPDVPLVPPTAPPPAPDDGATPLQPPSPNLAPDAGMAL
jgi:hypothetical protein